MIKPERLAGVPNGDGDPVLRWCRMDNLLVLCIALGTLGLLRWWRYPAPFPGEALRHIVELVGAWPRLSPGAPVWN